MKHLKHLKHVVATCICTQHPDLSRRGGGGVGKADGVVASGGKIASVCPDALTLALPVTMSDKWRKATKV
jgi:hypothetical protein